MVNGKLLRLSALILVCFAVVSTIGQILHPSRENPNDHVAVFREYAQSSDWTAVHVLQFGAAVLFVAGLLALYFAMNLPEGAPRWLGFFGALSAGITLALSGVQFAVDGVALKQAVDAWAGAPAAEQATRFANAEASRWLEWGTTSYADMMLGVTLLTLGITIVWSRRIAWPVGVLMGFSALGFIIKGWIIGVGGFLPSGSTPSSLAQALTGVWILLLAVLAWLVKPKTSTPRVS